MARPYSLEHAAGTDFTLLFCVQVLVFLIGSMLAGLLADWLGYGALFALATGLSLFSVLATVALLSDTGRARSRPECGSKTISENLRPQLLSATFRSQIFF